MRRPPFDLKAPKRTVSVTLNSDLYRRAKDVGINVSQVAEQALERDYLERLSETRRAELRKDLEALENYARQHGDFADFVKEHYERDDNAI